VVDEDSIVTLIDRLKNAPVACVEALGEAIRIGAWFDTPEVF
jgi:hypothetical protein